MNHNPLAALRLDDRFVRTLPGDSSRENRPRRVERACWSPVHPTPVRDPALIAWSPEAAALLGLTRPDDPHADPLVALLAGNLVPDGLTPYAACYGGHQFGAWAEQLGDGRAITLTEVLAPEGDAPARWDLQLKGAGRTPYSRRGDGRAVLRSSLREFVCSEAMHHLGVPTTRALALLTTGEPVLRDLFYDGRAREEPGAICVRIAPSFVRVGSFELFAARGDHRTLAALASHVLTTHFAHLGEPTPEAFAQLFSLVCARTGELIAHWMSLGFVHGVMNTDNLSVLGLTIDYGPFGWLDSFDPRFTPNTTDEPGRRYRFARQPHVASWNLARLGDALRPLFDPRDPARAQRALDDGLSAYERAYNTAYFARMARKLGLASLDDDRDDDATFLSSLFELFTVVETDPTVFFRLLARVPLEGPPSSQLSALEPAFYAPDALTDAHRAALARWLEAYRARLVGEHTDEATRCARMNAANPWFIPRNYLLQQAIDEAEHGTLTKLDALLDAMKSPYEESTKHPELGAKRPEWARTAPGCGALSCSS